MTDYLEHFDHLLPFLPSSTMPSGSEESFNLDVVPAPEMKRWCDYNSLRLDYIDDCSRDLIIMIIIDDNSQHLFVVDIARDENRRYVPIVYEVYWHQNQVGHISLWACTELCLCLCVFNEHEHFHLPVYISVYLSVYLLYLSPSIFLSVC